jgi:hypothetical protein
MRGSAIVLHSLFYAVDDLTVDAAVVRCRTLFERLIEIVGDALYGNGCHAATS